MEDENSRRKESRRGMARTMSHPAIWTEVRKDKATLEKQYRWKELATTEQRKLEKDGKTRRVEIEKIKRRKYGKAGKSKLTALEEAIMAGLARRMKEIAEIEKNMHLQKTRPKGWKVDHEEQGTMPTSDIVPEGRMVKKHDESEVDGKESLEIIWKRLEKNLEILKREEELKTTRGTENMSQDGQKELLGEVEEIEMAENDEKNDVQDLKN